MPLHDQKTGLGSTRRAGDPSTVKIALVGVLLALAVLSLGGLYVFSQQLKVTTDQETLCPIDRPIASVMVILLDASDQLTPAQLESVGNHLERIQAEVPRFGLVEAYMVDPNTGQLSEAVVHLCNPGSAMEVSRVYQNPDFAMKRWKTFHARLSQSLKDIMDSPSSDVSPIFEALQSLGLKTFEKPVYDRIPKRLIVVSDLVQNVPGKMNQYKEAVSYKVFHNSDYFMQIRPNLEDVAVDVLYLRRSGVSAQGAQHRKFWEQFIASSGASLESFEQIYGDRQ